jgi:molecular chaperone DnaK (HSP70)
MTMTGAFFGIDLGTGNCSVAYVTDDPRQRDQRIVEVRTVEVPVDDGEVGTSNRMPSIIAADWQRGSGGRHLFGWEFLQAFKKKRRSAAFMRGGVDYFASVKSDMGTNKVYPRSAVAGARTPGQVTTLILQRLSEIVTTNNSHHDLKDAHVTLTVPASFTALARAETKEAALAAGFDAARLELIDEPVAALVDLLNSSDAGAFLTDQFQNVLVFDYGAGTCDLSLVRARLNPARANGLEVVNLAISPYRTIGGDDVDRAVMEHIVWPQIASPVERALLTPEDRRSVEDTLTGTVARGLKERICRLVEKRFRKGGDWSVAQSGASETYPLEARFSIPSLQRQTPTQFKIVARDFARVMKPFVEIPGAGSECAKESLLRPIGETLERAGLRPDDLGVLVLHGGSSHNPYVRQMLQESLGRGFFSFGSLKVERTPDLLASVARGAALSAYWRHARGQDIVQPIVAEDLGIIVMGGDAKPLVRSAQLLPFPDEDAVEDVTAGEEEFVIPGDNLPELLVPVYTGRRETPKIAGVVKVPVPAGTPTGSRVRIKLRITREKTLEWWFSIGESAFERAPSVDDPWTAHASTRAERLLLEHRRAMRQIVDGGDALPWNMRVQEVVLQRDAGKRDEALGTVEELLAGGGGPLGRALNMKGLLLREQDDDPGALAAFQAAAEAEPANPILAGNVGCQLVDLGRRVEAVAAMRLALSMDPGLGYLYEHLAVVFRQDGNEEGAQRELGRAVVIAQQRIDAAPLDPRTWSDMARLRFMLGEYEMSSQAGHAAKELSRNEFFGGDSTAVIASRFGDKSWRRDES